MSRAVSACLAAALAALTATVVLGGDLPVERRAVEQLASRDRLDPLWRLVDAGTGYLPMGVLTGLLVLGLVVARHRHEALLTAVSVTGAVVGTTLLKQLVGRPRPEVLPSWAQVSELSFPSGHATVTAALAACAVLLVRSSAGRVAAAVAVLLVGVAGWAQLALGLHHPSDVLGGWLGAVAWVSFVWSAGRRR